MAIPVTCACGTPLLARDDQIGQILACPNCRLALTVRDPITPSRLESTRDSPGVLLRRRPNVPPGGKSAVPLVVASCLLGGLFFLVLAGGGAWLARSARSGRPTARDGAPAPVAGEPALPVLAGAGPAIALNGEQLYRRTLRSTAWIVVTDPRRPGFGSGALIDRDERLVITNYHVVEGTAVVSLFFPAYQGKELITSPRAYLQGRHQLGLTGRVVSRDPIHDLALVQLDRLPQGAFALPLARKSAEPGQRLASIGASGVNEILQGTLWRNTTGEVRQVYRQRMTLNNGQVLDSWTVETQAPVNQGDSGGPVVNDQGNLVAVVSSYNPRDRLVSVAIDVREVRAVVEAYYRPLGKKWQEAVPAQSTDANDYPNLVKALDSNDAAAKARAARALGDLGRESQSAVPALLRAWKDPSVLVKRQVQTALEKIGPPDADGVPTLVEALADADAGPRRYAARSLAELGTASRDALEALLKAAGDPDREVRRDCVTALGHLANEETAAVAPALLKGLNDAEVSVRQAAAAGLGLCGSRAHRQVFPALVRALRDPEVWETAAEALSTLGPPTVDDLQTLGDALKDPAPRVRSFAIKALVQMGAAAAPLVGDLAGALKDSDATVRAGAARALDQLGAAARAAAPALRQALADKDASVRRLAAEALGSFGRQEGLFGALLTALADEDEEVRASVLEALTRLGPPTKGDVGDLTAALRSPSPFVRLHAAEALSRLGAASGPALPDLQRALKDSSLRIRTVAANAIAAIGRDAEAAVPALIDALRDPLPPPDPRAEGAAPGTDVFKRLLQSAAWILREEDDGTVHSGSGWVVDRRNRLVVTNFHLVRPAKQVLVFFPDWDQGELVTQPRHYVQNVKRLGQYADVVGVDSGRDLVLLRLPRLPAEVRALPLAPVPASPGQAVHAVVASGTDRDGNQGRLWRYTKTEVRQVYRTSFRLSVTQLVDVRVVETLGPITGSDTGGAVVNDRLEVVGIATAFDGGARPVSACIEAGEVQAVLDDCLRPAGLPLPERPVAAPAVTATPAAFRKAVALALEKIGPGAVEALPALRKALADRDAAVRCQVAAALGALGPAAKPAVGDLVAAMQNDETRSAAAEAVAKIGKDAVPVLIKMLDDRDPSLVLETVRALGSIGPAAKDALYHLQILDSRRSSPELRKAAQDAVRAVTAKP